jgi:catalase
MKSDQGIKNLTGEQAAAIGATDPDYYKRDMFTAIENKNFPSWTVYAQVIDPRKAEALDDPSIFDITKTVSEEDFPLVPFGKITLNRNPENHFAEVEQSAFCPSNVVPGWDISPDPGKSNIPTKYFTMLMRES